jgi:hypothetical protein
MCGHESKQPLGRMTGRGNGRRLRFAGVAAAERPFRWADKGL